MKRIGLILLSLLLLCGCAAGEGEPTQITEQTLQTVPGEQSDEGFELGNTLPPMSVTTSEGETVVIGEVLEEKKLVVLNFWYADCVWCQREFPVLELAYSRYQENVEVFALNPLDEADAAQRFWDSQSLSMPMGTCSRDTALMLGVSGYPTSVFIDREGKISLIHGGAITDPQMFYDLFDHYIAEDYISQSYGSVQELLGENE